MRLSRLARLLLPSPTHLSAQQSAPAGVTVGDSDLGGVVTSANGPEAGVWVIAETTDLPTKFVKIVVTDDQGRYVLPELPKANYDVWVRGYGLVDSPKIEVGARPHRQSHRDSLRRARPRRPNIIRRSIGTRCSKIPERSMFPGTGPNGNGMPERIRSQGQWIATLKTHGCNSCHQVGNKPTRTISKALGEFDSSYAAWMHRLQVGPAAENMVRGINELDTPRLLKQFADWTDTHRRRRAADVEAAAAARRRAQRRGDAVGLGRCQDLPA